MYGTVRRYRVRLGTVPQAVKYVRGNLLPLLRQIPGFTAYYIVQCGEQHAREPHHLPDG